MNDQSNQIQFECELTEALAADDVVAALDELSQRYADNAQASERIRSARRIVDGLVSIGERLADKPTPEMPKLDIRAWRIRPWWIAVPAAAAAVAAAVIIAVLLQSPTTTETPHPPVIAPATPHQPALAWRVPSVTPISLPDGAFTVPKITIPSISTSLPKIEWNVPSVTGDYSERSNGNET